ncbi:MAG: PAS domain-containing protein [Bacteroidales bacterium]|jgi:PAS domain S-box-containing protein|nr:PAS domain-containing protein [Bacteroidales bacterium]
MKNNIANKLFKGLTGMLIGNVLIALTGLVCILVLTNTSNNIVVEYIELEAVQELRISVNQIIAPAYDYIRYKEENNYAKYDSYLNNAYSNIDNCLSNLSHRHNKSLMIKIKQNLELFNKIVIEFSEHNFSQKVSNSFINEIDIIINEIHVDLQSILVETNAEIINHTVVYKTSSKHSIIAIIGFSIILLFIGYKWGLKFVQRINIPIRNLVKSTQMIANGNFTIRANVNTGDEIEELGISFNRMIEEIENLTVSRDYFDSIITGMFESLLVTNTDGEILTINNATCDLLSYSKSELINKNISVIIKDKESGFKLKASELIKYGAQHNKEKEYISKSGEIIPVLFSCSILKDRDDNFSGVIFIAHDLRESKKAEEKLSKIRKEHLIEINEAQEKERLRIASEIHDGLGQMLTAISYSIENNFTKKPKVEKEYTKHVVRLQTLIDNTIKESKIIAYDLIPILLKDFGLVTAVENLISEIQSKHSVKINFEAFNFTKRFDTRLEKALYRIIQEALNNIIKHSKASQSNIHIINHTDTVSVVIEDNGVGFDVKAESLRTEHKGIGLISMEERVSAFSGFINFNSAKNQGTEIIIDIPLKEN